MAFALKMPKLGSTYGPDHDNVGHFWMKSCNFMMEKAVFGCLQSNTVVIFCTEWSCLLENGIEVTK